MKLKSLRFLPMTYSACVCMLMAVPLTQQRLGIPAATDGACAALSVCVCCLVLLDSKGKHFPMCLSSYRVSVRVSSCPPLHSDVSSSDHPETPLVAHRTCELHRENTSSYRCGGRVLGHHRKQSMRLESDIILQDAWTQHPGISLHSCCPG